MRVLRSSLRVFAMLVLFVAVGIAAASPSSADQLSNINGVHDPSRMIFDPVGNRWIIWWTGNGIPSATSPDKVTWTSGPAVFPNGNPLRANYWAPDMWDTPIHGKYYLFYSLSAFGDQRSSIKVASTPALTSPTWQFVGDVVVSDIGDLFNAIDPAPFYDAEADRLWVMFGSFWTGIYIVEVDPLDPSRQVSGYTHLAGGRYNGSHPNNPSGQAGQNAMEGPYIFKRNGWYYLNVSVDSCCRGSSSTYKMIVGRSRSITGPYVDRDGVDLVVNGGTIFMAGSGPEIGPGQFAQYTLNGKERFSYHFYLASNGQSRHGGREIEWGADDWPKAVFAKTIDRGIYRIRKGASLRLAVRGESKDPTAEAHLEQDSATGRPSQNWLFVPTVSPAGDTYYTIQNVGTRFFLDVADGHREEGDFIRQWYQAEPGHDESQQWRVLAVGDAGGSYQLQSVRSGRVPGINDMSQADFATVMQKDWMVGSATVPYRDSNNVTRLTIQADMRYALEPVVDTDPPVLTLPANITVTATSPAGAAVTFAASALDAISGAVPVSYSVAPGSTFPIGTTTVEVTATDDLFNTATGTFTVTVVRKLTALGAAEVWVGLKNSDDAGLRVDLRADVLVGGALVGQGQVDNVTAGSSGFQNAVRNTIPLTLTNGAAAVPPGASLQVNVWVRRTCASVAGHLSGTARLWFDGKAVDTGAARDAGTGFVATIAGVEAEYFLRSAQALSSQAGASKVSGDKTVDSKQACAERFTSFGTWSVALP